MFQFDFTTSNFLLIFSGFLSFFIGFLVYLKNQKNLVNLFFMGFAFSVSLWVISNFFIDTSLDPAIVLLWSRLTAVANSFLPSLFLLFTVSFLEMRFSFKSPLFLILTVISFTFCILSLFGNMIISGISLDVYPVIVYHGILFPYYSLFLLLSLLTSVFLIIFRFFTSTGYRKKQLLLLSIGSASMILISLTTNLILPFFEISSAFTRIGPLSAFFFILFTAISVLRYRFLDINVLIKRKSFQTVLSTIAFILIIYAISWMLYTGNITSLLLLFEKNFSFLDVVLLFACIFNLALAIIVLKQNIRSRVHIIFFFIGISLSMWCLGILMTYVIDPFSDYFLFWNNFAFLGPYLLPTFFVLIAHSIPQVQKLSHIQKIFISLGFLTFFFSPFSVVGITSYGDLINSWFVTNIFPIYVLGYIVWALMTFMKSYRKAKKSQKQQIFYIFLAFFSMLFPACITNLLIPTFFNNISLNQIGPASSLLFFSFFSLAVLRYRFLDIMLLLRRSLLTILVYFGFFAVFTYLISLQELSWYAQPFILLLAVFFFDTLRKSVQKIVDKLFPHRDIDLVDTFSKVEKTPSRVEKLHEYMPILIQDACKKFEAEHGILLVKDTIRGVESSSMHPKKVFLSRANYDHLFEFFTKKTRILTISNVQERDEKSYEILKNLNTEVAMTVRHPDSFVGILILGKRKGDWDMDAKDAFMDYQKKIQNLVQGLLFGDRVAVESYKEYMEYLRRNGKEPT